jgi:uncharacterized membrane protein
MSSSLLLVAFLLLLVVEPFVTQQTSTNVTFGIAVSIVLVAAIWAVSCHRGLLFRQSLAGRSMATADDPLLRVHRSSSFARCFTTPR